VKDKKSFPDLNKDGKVTKADVLKGRGVEGFARGGSVKASTDQSMCSPRKRMAMGMKDK